MNDLCMGGGLSFFHLIGAFMAIDRRACFTGLEGSSVIGILPRTIRGSL